MTSGQALLLSAPSPLLLGRIPAAGLSPAPESCAPLGPHASTVIIIITDKNPLHCFPKLQVRYPPTCSHSRVIIFPTEKCFVLFQENYSSVFLLKPQQNSGSKWLLYFCHIIYCSPVRLFTRTAWDEYTKLYINAAVTDQNKHPMQHRCFIQHLPKNIIVFFLCWSLLLKEGYWGKLF